MATLRGIVVDDERLALKKMERLLQEQDGQAEFEWIGIFQDPYAAIEGAKQCRIDVAFLDIEMPELDGFDLAEELIAIQPQIQVVFVTAYQEYAIKAFEKNALDYLLKPVQNLRLNITLQRIIKYLPESIQDKEQLPQRAMICCLQSLHFINARGEKQSFSWKTLKAQELFSYLLYNRNKTVNKQVLIELLWPNYDDERGTTQLHTAIYQIRKVIRSLGLDLNIRYQDEGYRLLWGDVDLDVQQWELMMDKAPSVTFATIEEHQRLMGQYVGDFLEEHAYEWAEHERERLRMIWLNHAKQIAECCLVHEKHTDAILVYQLIRSRLPSSEDGYFGLMRIYALLNHRGEVHKQYQMLVRQLEDELGVEPSREVAVWYDQWQNGTPAEQLDGKVG